MPERSLSSLMESVEAAYRLKKNVSIVGSGSKLSHFGLAQPGPDGGQLLSTLEHAGVISYDPTELVVRVKSGTLLSELELVLAEHHQRLAFEPPQLKGSGTVGGMLATAMAGPSRPWAGGVRDYVLGASLINGKGEHLNFGGQVMKNVAGFDVSRLLAGSFGSLGLITDVSLKVLPKPESVRYFKVPQPPSEFLQQAQQWYVQMSPVSGLAHDGEYGRVRIGGYTKSLDEFSVVHKLAADADGEEFWHRLQHLKGPFFETDELWRLSVPLWTDVPELHGHSMLDWAGAQYWVKGLAERELIRLADQHRGSLYACHGDGRFYPPLPDVTQDLHRRLKSAYDPAQVCNADHWISKI